MFNRSYIDRHKGHPEYLNHAQIQLLIRKVKLSNDDRKIMLIIKHLSDPTKFKIYLLLKNVQEIPVTDITNVLGISQSSVSHALSDLKNLELVESHRCGQLICYSLIKNAKTNKFFQYINKFKL